MGNIMIGLKKFLSNKNTVTIIGVLVAIVVLYVGYNMRVQAAVNPQDIPCATQTISPGTRITEDMIEIIQVPPSMLKGSPITEVANIVGKYVANDTVIPIGSLFYSRSVVEKSQLADAIIQDIPDGYVLVNMSVDTQSTYGNSVYPENYIDIYLRATNRLEEGTSNEEDRIMVGKLIENVKVIAVLDSAGNNVFANLEDKQTPAMIIFAVPEEYHILLRKAMYLRSYDASLFIVPTDESLKEEKGEVRIASEELRDWINSVTYWTEDMSGGNISATTDNNQNQAKTQ